MATSARSHAVKGRLGAQFRSAELVIADARGGLQRLAVDAQQLARGVPIAPEVPRPLQIQLVARGRRGPRPVAERTVPASDQASAVSRVIDDGLWPSSAMSDGTQHRWLLAIDTSSDWTGVALTDGAAVFDSEGVLRELGVRVDKPPPTS